MVRILAIPAILLIAMTPALAQHGHSSGMSMGHSGTDLGSHMSAQGLESTNGPRAADRDFGRDRAEDRMSAQGLESTNGPRAADRDFGRDRAEDRMSGKGLTHSNTDHTKRHKHHEPHDQ